MLPDELVSILRELAAICRQDERGYLAAAEAARHSDIQTILQNYSRQRSRMTGELEQHITRLAGNRLPAGMQRFGAWADLSASAHDDEAAVLAECARSETITRERFERALKHDLPLNIKMVVHRQYTEIKTALQWLGQAQLAAQKHSFHET